MFLDINAKSHLLIYRGILLRKYKRRNSTGIGRGERGGEGKCFRAARIIGAMDLN